MGSIGPAEILIVLIIGLIVLGPTRLPEAAKQVGKAVSEFRRVTGGLQAEVRDAFADPVPGTHPVPPAPTSSAVAASVAELGEVNASPSIGPAPWANPPIPVEGPRPSANGDAAPTPPADGAPTPPADAPPTDTPSADTPTA